MSYTKYTKDPASVLDYLNNWQGTTDPFLGEDETITASAWVAYTTQWVATDNITIDSDSHTDTTATVWLSGGTTGEKYFITNHITTNEGREQDWSFIIVMKEL